MTPLIMATLEGEGHGQGHLDVVRALLGHPQIDPNKGMKSDSATALYYASEAGHPDYVRLLIGHHKTDVNKGKTDGRTPLYRLKIKILRERILLSNFDLRDLVQVVY